MRKIATSLHLRFVTKVELFSMTKSVNRELYWDRYRTRDNDFEHVIARDVRGGRNNHVMDQNRSAPSRQLSIS